MPDEPYHHTLDEKFTCRQKIRKFGILSLQVGLGIFDHVAFQGALTVNERGDDVFRTRFADLENHEVAIADEGADHGFATHFQRKAFR